MSNDQCIFCKIIAGTIPCYKVYETESVIAFLDIYPVHPGHVLVVPKIHAQEFTDLSWPALDEVMHAVWIVMRGQQTTLSCEGVNILQNNGSAAGQVVPHVHFHLIPRWSDDGLHHWPGAPLASERGVEIAVRVSEVIQQQLSKHPTADPLIQQHRA